VMSVRGILAVGASAAVLASGGLLVAAPANAAPMTVQVIDGVAAQPGITTGELVTGTGVQSSKPVTITWGDGTAQVARTTCSKRKARLRPNKCSIGVGHVYYNPGTYTVTVQGKKGKILGTGTVTVTSPSSNKSPYTPTPQYREVPQWRSSMLARVNEVRAQNGAGPVGSCPRLDQVSQDYAQLMADTGHFDHTGPGGESPWDRMRAGGYDYRGAGENIAWGQRHANRVQKGWEESVGHFRNMINPGHTDAGFGAAKSAGGDWYWVQMYGTGGNCDLNGGQVETTAPAKISD